MEKIKLNKHDDYVQLKEDQVKGLFGYSSEEIRCLKAGMSISIARVSGADRGFFSVIVATENQEYEHFAAIGDDKIEQWIDFDQEEKEEFDSELTTHEEYRRDHPNGYFI